MIHPLELSQSIRYHENHLPLLVSSKVLRFFGASQIDISFIQKKQFGPSEIFLIEVKNSLIGVKSSSRYHRLVREKKIILLLGYFFPNEQISFYYTFQKSHFDDDGLS